MDDTRYNQRDQRVETQVNADTIDFHLPAVPEEGQSVAVPSPSVTGAANVDTVTGGRVGGVYIEHQTIINPGTATPMSPSSGHSTPPPGRIHGNPPMLSVAFTGREDTLRALHAVLHTNNAALTPPDNPLPRNGVPPRAALQGLGGMGKTQTALAYLYRHQNDYADLFWAIGETPEQLASQLAAFAPTLDPPIPVQADQNAILQQVKQWFATHDNWLLVVDNAENLPKLKNVLPPLNRGRLLLTTRDVAMKGSTGAWAEYDWRSTSRLCEAARQLGTDVLLSTPLRGSRTSVQAGVGHHAPRFGRTPPLLRHPPQQSRLGVL